MSLIVFKTIAASLILLTALVAGIIPIRSHLLNPDKKSLRIGEAFACGVFFGAAIFHLLPEANHSFQEIYPNLRYPIVNLACVLGFLLLLLIERGFKQIHSGASQSTLIAYLLATILSVHSVIAGSALGIDKTSAGAFILFFAIMAHKSSASYALAINLNRSNISPKGRILILSIFSIMTPIGILLGSLGSHNLDYHQSDLLQSLFNAFAAGTFFTVSAA